MTDYASDQVSELFRDNVTTQVALLRGLVLDLMTEVEALRATQLAGSADSIARYRRAYEATVLESHNSAGPFSGVHRVFWAWYGQAAPPEITFDVLVDHVRREVTLLRRMGASDEEIAAHLRRVEEHATRT
jgi:hypothetical protein